MKIFNEIWSRVSTHWLMSVKGVTYAVLTFLVATGKITVQEWAMYTGGIMAVNGLISKDPNKTADKNNAPGV